MNQNLKKIHQYFMEKGIAEEDLAKLDGSTVYLAIEISEYAHRDQTRENGEEYANHPKRCLETYRKLVGIKPNDYFCIDVDLMYEHGIPFEGVQEVCVLHDVIEDSEFTLEDVRGIYVDCGFKRYFDLYIKDALRRITHDKSVGYDAYIKIVLENPISALVKMIDMQDNLKVMDLIDYGLKRYWRAQDYLYWTYFINSCYHFVENSEKYRKAFQKENA